MEMQKAEIVPGMQYRGRKIYLEQKGNTNAEIAKDLPNCKRDAIHFSMQTKEACNRLGKAGQIIWVR